MKDIFDQIKQQAARGLFVRVVDLKNSEASSTESQSSFIIGDQIEFTLTVWNNSPYELSNLDIRINEMTAVKLVENPLNVHIQHLSIDDQRPIITLKGTVVENPNDAGSIYEIKDYLCRVKITGDINLPPIHFEDVELETINITDR
jgi:hypothetical protein